MEDDSYLHYEKDGSDLEGSDLESGVKEVLENEDDVDGQRNGIASVMKDNEVNCISFIRWNQTDLFHVDSSPLRLETPIDSESLLPPLLELALYLDQDPPTWTLATLLVERLQAR